MRLTCLVLLVCGGCFEEQTLRLPSHFTDSIQVSRTEPGGVCRTLGAIEGRSRDSDESQYESAYDVLRSNAALRGGNYVVIDVVNATHLQSGNSTYEGSLVIQGRLYQCSLSAPSAMMQLRERLARLPLEGE